MSYAYDAWGNFITTYHNGGASTRAAKNPFTYRGYYYDRDLKLYYLNSRYYDSVIGRFINADSYISTGQSFVGYNMFAYCNNNPVSYVDKSGNRASGVFLQFLVSAASYIGMAVASIFDDEIKEDMDRIGWNPFNTSEDTVLDSKKVSFYKGIPVILTAWDRGSLSFGVILFDTARHDGNANVLKHERGHSTQLMTMGLTAYLLLIGIPSPIENKDITPWELSASMLGKSGFASYANSNQKRDAAIYYTCAVSNIPILWCVNVSYMMKEY